MKDLYIQIGLAHGLRDNTMVRLSAAIDLGSAVVSKTNYRLHMIHIVRQWKVYDK